jgi:hypothetical protein
MGSDLFRFEAGRIGQAAISKDGSEFVLEFKAGEQRLWVTLPMSALSRVEEVVREVRRLSSDASGVGRSTCVP